MKNLYSSVTLFLSTARSRSQRHNTHHPPHQQQKKKKSSAQAGDEGNLLEMQTQNNQVIKPELLQQYHSTQHTK